MAKPGSQRNPTIESLKDRIARDPFSRAFLQLAEEYRREGRFQEAIEVCLEGLQRHPTYHTARISLGRTYMEAGDMENARRAFSEVLELQPENHLAAKLLAEIQRKMGDLAGAAATYRGILRYYPNDREVATLLQESQRPEPGAAPAAPPPATPPVTARSASPLVPPPASAAQVVTPSAFAATAPQPTKVVLPKGRSPVAAAAAPAAGPGPVSWPGVPAARLSDPSPDFRPEDLGGAPVAAPAQPGHAAAGALPPPWSGPGRDDDHEAVDDALQTNTLAELYLRQGLVDRA